MQSRNYLSMFLSCNRPALHWAVVAAELSIQDCESLYQAMTPEQICYRMNGRLQTALHFAVHANRPAMVDLLISRGDVREKLIEIPDNNGWTDLHWAVKSNFESIIKILVDNK